MTQTMGTLIVLLSTGMWGISGVCGQYLFEHTQIDSTWLIAVRQILAGLMYMMVIVQRGKEPLFAIFRAQRQTLWKMLCLCRAPASADAASTCGKKGSRGNLYGSYGCLSCFHPWQPD